MIQVGDTFDGFDDRGHLYVVLSRPTVHDRIAVANLTSHYAERLRDNEECVIIRPEDPWVRRVSCMFYQRANFVRYSMLDNGIHSGEVQNHPKCSRGTSETNPSGRTGCRGSGRRREGSDLGLTC